MYIYVYAYYAMSRQALVSLKKGKNVYAEGWCKKAVVIEGG